MGLLRDRLTPVLIDQAGRSTRSARGELKLNGREFAEMPLTSPPVVGALDPGDDLEAQLAAAPPAALVKDFVVEK
jgi:hypothetical protein